jgi:hypothetical protein
MMPKSMRMKTGPKNDLMEGKVKVRLTDGTIVQGYTSDRVYLDNGKSFMKVKVEIYGSNFYVEYAESTVLKVIKTQGEYLHA